MIYDTSIYEYVSVQITYLYFRSDYSFLDNKVWSFIIFVVLSEFV